MPPKSKTNQRSRPAKTASARPAKSASGGRPSKAKSHVAPKGKGPRTATKAEGRPGRKSAVKASAAKRAQGRVESLAALGTAEAARPARQTGKSAELAKAAIDAALDKKALLPVLIDVSAMASYTDFIAIVSGRSDRHVDAIADGVRQEMKARGRTLLGQEGSGSGRWSLLDFGDVVIHVFYHPVREFYDLESLWVDAPRLPLKIPPESIIAQPDALYGNL